MRRHSERMQPKAQASAAFTRAAVNGTCAEPDACRIEYRVGQRGRHRALAASPPPRRRLVRTVDQCDFDRRDLRERQNRITEPSRRW